MPTKCYWIRTTEIYSAYTSVAWGKCLKNPFYETHRADIVYATGPKSTVEPLYYASKLRDHVLPADVVCEYCGEAGRAEVSTGGGMGTEWYRPDTGETHRYAHQFAPGAMYLADWYLKDNGLYGWDWDNQTEPPVIVILPGGHEWNISSRASNCTLPNDRKHRCWIQHGTIPNLTVDKAGLTCGAGAGSILVPGYHGFLRDGVLT